MASLRYFLPFLFLLLSGCNAFKKSSPDIIDHTGGAVTEPGVSAPLARYRKAMITKIRYDLHFDIPANRDSQILASAYLSFQLRHRPKGDLQLDFKEVPAKLKTLTVNGKPVPLRCQDEHLLIPENQLVKGDNRIEINFIAGESALNRNPDYLYTLFVPDRARTVFPCFDQPDLKAVYALTLTLPEAWDVIANARLKATTYPASGRKQLQYAVSDTLSTYLFAFAAGKFRKDSLQLSTGNADFLFRETDTAKIRQSVRTIFNLHKDALKFMEEWTGIPYPFQKFGFVAIPDFQFGGMEHPGAIQYKSSALFLDAGATMDQQNARTNVIAHETAHMWFGDLVTMNWFTDVWMKEVFANFMADKSTEAQTGREMFDLKFLTDHFPAAYSIDRTSGSNPIRQELANLQDAGTLYGNIIYHKAPIMMRQLERLMGKEAFQRGVREYLRRFANSNASWPDLIRILDQHSPADLEQWNKVWVNEPGRPVIGYQLDTVSGKISKLLVTQSPEYGQKRIWPQLFELRLFYKDRSKELTINLDQPQVEVTEASGLEVPLFIQFNSSGQGYGLFPADARILPALYSLKSPLNRASAYIGLYENMLNGRTIRPAELLDRFTEGLSREPEELNLKLLTGYLINIYWQFITEPERNQRMHTLEQKLWDAMLHQSKPNHKKLLFRAYQDICISAGAQKKLYAIWSSQRAPEGMRLTEDDYTSIAFSLMLRSYKDSGIAAKQRDRISNPDRLKRFDFILPALSAGVEQRDAFFASLAQKANREKEANVVTALYYLHHPLRQVSSIRYLSKSLQMLSEIQTTGDIFFPQNWLQTTLSFYHSPEAASIVNDFLKQHPDYNPKLRAKLLQAADPLFRACNLLSQTGL